MRRAAIALLILLPCLVHAPELLGLFRADPALSFSGLGVGVGNALVPGLPLIDPSIGSYHEALGFRAIDTLLHGKMPWWNPFEGVGLPLAGEMNSSPFYPLMTLLELPRGYVVINVVVQILAGIATFALLCRLKVAAMGALFGAVFFEFNGTFAWLSGGWSYAIPALPLLILGLEYSLDGLMKRKLIGIMIIGLALAISISAGFIEIAFLDGVFGVGWAVIRLIGTPGGSRAFAFATMVGSAVLGLMLAAPILIAFVDYLRVANVGIHTGEASPSLLPIGLTQLVLPYAFAQIFQIATFAPLWGSVGGYAGDALCVLAIYGTFGQTRRYVRVFLAVWIILCLGTTFGQPLLQKILTSVPGVRYTAYYRYLNASWEFAMALLAAFAIDDMLALPARAALKRMVLAVGLTIVFIAVPLEQNATILIDKNAAGSFTAWFATSLGIAATTMVLLAVASLWKDPARRSITVGLIACVQIVGYYALPTLAYPREGHIELGSVRYLREHLGLQRFYSLGPIAPNYGSYYGVASINHNDIPIAKRWVDDVVAHLDPYVDPVLFTGTLPLPTPTIPGRDAMLMRNVREFGQRGVRYVVTPPDTNLGRTVVTPGAGDADQAPLVLMKNDRVTLAIANVPPGRLDQIEVLEGNYSNTSDGILRAVVCDVARCHSTQIALDTSIDNTAMPLHFIDPPLLPGGRVTITFQRVSGSQPFALWEYDGGPISEPSLGQNGHALAGKSVHVKLIFDSSKVDFRLVYHDVVSEIYELSDAVPYYSAPHCSFANEGRLRVEASCSAPSIMRRSELFMDGWTGRVNGSARPISLASDHLVQSMSIPAGRSTVEFSFTPPFMAYGYASFALAFATLGGLWFLALRLPRTSLERSTTHAADL